MFSKRSRSNVQSATTQSRNTPSKISITYNSWLNRFGINPKTEMVKEKVVHSSNTSERCFDGLINYDSPVKGKQVHTRFSGQYTKKTGFILQPAKNENTPKIKVNNVIRISSQLVNKAQIQVQKNPTLYRKTPLKDYTIGSTIGTGAYGTVKYGIQKSTQKRVAIKIYNKSKFSEKNQEKTIQNEIKILSKIDYPNIVKLYHTIDTPKSIYIILEYISGGSLNTLLKRKTNRRLEELEASKIFEKLLLTLDHLHSKNITHRDIKLENTLIDQNGNVKVIDFGFATCFSNDKKTKLFCGTPNYMAPEIVGKKEYYGPPVDIWAAGVLLFVLLTGIFPFRANNDKELYKKIISGYYVVPEYVSNKAQSLIGKMINLDPDKRPTAGELLKDPWIMKFSGSNTEINVNCCGEYKEN